MQGFTEERSCMHAIHQMTITEAAGKSNTLVSSEKVSIKPHLLAFHYVVVIWMQHGPLWITECIDVILYFELICWQIFGCFDLKMMCIFGSVKRRINYWTSITNLIKWSFSQKTSISFYYSIVKIGTTLFSDTAYETMCRILVC